MPVTTRSRYHRLKVRHAPDADGEPQAMLPIRRHTDVPTGGSRYRHQLTGAESMEYLAWRYQGNSESWWRIADANPLRFPLDWRPGELLQVAGGSRGLVVRDRRF